jgi:hypothetical protein
VPVLGLVLMACMMLVLVLVVWLVLVYELHKVYGYAVTIHEDHQRFIALSKSIMPTGRSKHKNVRCHFCREKAESGDIEVKHCTSENMLAYVLIKPWVNGRHTQLCHAIMGLHN